MKVSFEYELQKGKHKRNIFGFKKKRKEIILLLVTAFYCSYNCLLYVFGINKALETSPPAPYWWPRVQKGKGRG
jgi:hypothetical protein